MKILLFVVFALCSLSISAAGSGESSVDGTMGFFSLASSFFSDISNFLFSFKIIWRIVYPLSFAPKKMNAQRKLSNKSADNAKSALCVIASGACIVFTFTMD